MTTTIQDQAIKTCERLSCHEIAEDDAEYLQQEWDCDPRWKGIHRPYTPEEVLKLRETLKLEHTFAQVGAQRLWYLLQTEEYIAALDGSTEKEQF
jgi:isocitrate lyase